MGAAAHGGHDTTSHLRLPPNPSSPYDGPWAGSEADPGDKLRERLRKWEMDNPPPSVVVRSNDDAVGLVSNSMSGTVDEYKFLRGLNEPTDSDTDVSFVGDELVNVGLPSVGLKAGDLLELGADSLRFSLLAVCLGNFNGYDHFYTNSGKWVTSQNIKTRFVVRNFIQDPDELQVVIDALPSTSGAADVLVAYHMLNAAPSREIGASLIRHMNNFDAAARRIQQTYAEKLNQIYQLLGPEEKLMSLGEIARLVLPGGPMKSHHTFPPDVLYAVYTFLCSDDLAFRPVGQGGRNHQSSLFLMNTKDDIENGKKVELITRQFYEARAARAAQRRGVAPTAATKSLVGKLAETKSVIEFSEFIVEARRFIDQSRKSRKWSPHGMLGPSTLKPTPIPVEWSSTALQIVRFMEQWAAAARVSRVSRLHGAGAAILRAVDRYGDAMLLDANTGWTFLQEIGWITPWDLQTRHSLHLPGVNIDRAGILAVEQEDLEPIKFEPDQLAPLRTDFAGTVYCIDAESAADIDDGVSIEDAGDGAYWVHIHVADPASRIRHDMPAARRAAILSQSIYLQGYEHTMFIDNTVRETFSLAPDRPSLTFSAKVNEAGDILDYKVTPAIIRDVVYITPENVSEICGDEVEDVTVPPDSFEVGTRPTESEPPTRKMAKPAELSEHQLSEIRILSRLSKALHQVRIRNGAVPTQPPRMDVEVSLEHTEVARYADGFLGCSGDPYIRLSYRPGNFNTFTSSLMLTGGEVAARWCSDRDIPIPYRVEPLASGNIAALRDFTQKILYPELASNKKPVGEHMRTLSVLTGGHDISTRPSTNFTMGIDKYAKATSPLRRFSDLIVHWQIEAALLEEHRRGSSLVVNTKSRDRTAKTFLPFSNGDLEYDMFPLLRLREYHARIMERLEGPSSWALQALLRGWRFGENAEQLPRTFRFAVNFILTNGIIKGKLDWFDQIAMLDSRHLGGLCRLSEIKTGDVFVVEIDTIITTSRKIYVRALERVEQ